LSRSRIQKGEALAIARKLGATIDPDGPHQIATFEYDGKAILTFGIRHGKKGGHGHLVGRYRELRMGETKVMALASCAMSKDEYVQYLIDIGDISQ